MCSVDLINLSQCVFTQQISILEFRAVINQRNPWLSEAMKISTKNRLNRHFCHVIIIDRHYHLLR